MVELLILYELRAGEQRPQQPQQPSVLARVYSFVVDHNSKTLTVGLLRAERETGSARRRRERRLRSWLRHERMTVRMELAAALHHSAYKDAGPETNDALRSQETVNSREGAVFFELYDEDTAGWRPPCLGEPPGPQARVLQCTRRPPTQPELFELSFDAEPGGVRPASLAERGRTSGFCGTPWSRSSSPSCSCR